MATESVNFDLSPLNITTELERHCKEFAASYVETLQDDFDEEVQKVHVERIDAKLHRLVEKLRACREEIENDEQKKGSLRADTEKLLHTHRETKAFAKEFEKSYKGHKTETASLMEKYSAMKKEEFELVRQSDEDKKQKQSLDEKLAVVSQAMDGVAMENADLIAERDSWRDAQISEKEWEERVAALVRVDEKLEAFRKSQVEVKELVRDAIRLNEASEDKLRQLKEDHDGLQNGTAQLETETELIMQLFEEEERMQDANKEVIERSLLSTKEICDLQRAEKQSKHTDQMILVDGEIANLELQKNSENATYAERLKEEKAIEHDLAQMHADMWGLRQKIKRDLQSQLKRETEEYNRLYKTALKLDFEAKQVTTPIKPHKRRSTQEEGEGPMDGPSDGVFKRPAAPITKHRSSVEINNSLFADMRRGTAAASVQVDDTVEISVSPASKDTASTAEMPPPTEDTTARDDNESVITMSSFGSFSSLESGLKSFVDEK